MKEKEALRKQHEEEMEALKKQVADAKSDAEKEKEALSVVTNATTSIEHDWSDTSRI